jgi:hypothetical protein
MRNIYLRLGVRLYALAPLIGQISSYGQIKIQPGPKPYL